MPRMYRVMKQSDTDGKPEIGDTATKLGIRETDLPPRDGNAHPGEGGMSVVSSPAYRQALVDTRDQWASGEGDPDE